MSDFNIGGSDNNQFGGSGSGWNPNQMANSGGEKTDSAFANWLIGTGLVKTRKSADAVMLVFAIVGIAFSAYLTVNAF